MEQIYQTTNETINRLLSEYCKAHDIDSLVKIPDGVDTLLKKAELVLRNNINREQRYNRVVLNVSLANIALRKYCMSVSSLPLEIYTDENVFILKKSEDITETYGVNGFRRLKHITEQLPYDTLALSMILLGELKPETYRIALQEFRAYKKKVDGINPILKSTNEILLDIAMRR